MAELFHRIEQQRHAERAVLVHLEIADEAQSEDLAEFQELVSSAGVTEVALVTARVSNFRARTLLGRGKVEEIAQLAATLAADVIIVNFALSPSQERNLANDCQVRVVDRVGLILDIFAQRAQSHEGKLQVELAQLKHMSTRLVGGWTHLERQKGGIGLRGPGETQLESDRRLLQERMLMLEKRLAKVRSHRALSRKSRAKNDLPIVVLVGYTNAGKSTIFNALTQAGVYAQDRLFATLDTTIRRIHLPGVGACVLADTVGFIRHIPHDLVAAFRATLEEATNADLLLHVVDAVDVRRDDKIHDVLQVLTEIGAEQIPSILVYNKTDMCQPAIQPYLSPITQQAFVQDQSAPMREAWVSAHSTQGMSLLIQAIAEQLAGAQVRVRVGLWPHQGKIRSRLYATGQVLEEVFDDKGLSWLMLKLSPTQWHEISHNEQIEFKEQLASLAHSA